jgi:hypothetical protein
MNGRRRIDVRIEELVLEGFDAGDAGAVGEALRLELARVLSAGVPAPALRATAGAAHVDGGEIAAGPGAGPRAAGAAAGQSLGAALKRGGAR